MLDKIHTAAFDSMKGIISPEHAVKYIERVTREAMAHNQDANDQIERLLKMVDEAQDKWNEAADAWEQDKLNKQLGRELDDAVRQHHDASTELAIQLQAIWKQGLRLKE